MTRASAGGFLALSTLLAAWTAVTAFASETAPLLQRAAGGLATSQGDEKRILATRISGLTEAQQRKALRGEAFFNSSFEPTPFESDLRDGLGPLFNAANCRSCHNSLGRGRPHFGDNVVSISLVLQLSAPGVDGQWGPDPNYGVNFNPLSIPGVPPEGTVVVTHEPITGKYADGTEWTLLKPVYELRDLGYGALHPEVAISPRLAQPIIGMGLLDAVAEADILSRADPDDANQDGISGRPNLLRGPDGEIVLGRFGWKANQIDLRAQTAAALFAEIGITTTDHPNQNCTESQSECLAAPHGGDPELSDADLEAIVFFQQTLAVPPRRNLDSPKVIRGAEMFLHARCGSCHTPSMKTGDVPGLPQLSNQRIYPFSDLLLHDMGPQLADGRPDGEASGSEWRTAPLWGLGRSAEIAGEAFYLHDGRARSIEESILWHGGEAAQSQAIFVGLNREDREALLAFLESL